LRAGLRPWPRVGLTAAQGQACMGAPGVVGCRSSGFSGVSSEAVVSRRGAAGRSSDGVVKVRNLTGHDVVLGVAGSGGESGAVAVPAEGGRAWVADVEVDRRDLMTDRGGLQEVRLRRGRAVVGLPAERAGVVLLVPRLTALAARDRGDLRFPYGERRDAAGRVVGARAVAGFPARRLVRGGRRGGPRWWQDVPAITVATGVVFAVATALLGAFLGVLSDIIAGDPAAPDFVPHVVTCAVLGVVGFACLAGGVWLWSRRRLLLHERGTAYVVAEQSSAWTYEERRAFFTRLEIDFATVRRVPGPADLGAEWRWPLGPGAAEWPLLPRVEHRQVPGPADDRLPRSCGGGRACSASSRGPFRWSVSDGGAARGRISWPIHMGSCGDRFGRCRDGGRAAGRGDPVR
jgi:hypothetical protein